MQEEPNIFLNTNYKLFQHLIYLIPWSQNSPLLEMIIYISIVAIKYNKLRILRLLFIEFPLMEFNEV